MHIHSTFESQMRFSDWEDLALRNMLRLLCLSSLELQARCSARRRSSIHFFNHTTHGIAELLDHVFVSWKRVALCVIENKGRIRITHVVKSDISM
jgi:hypothetical protein